MRAADERLACVQRMTALADEPRDGACMGHVSGEGWTAQAAPPCMSALSSDHAAECAREPSSPERALRAKEACAAAERELDEAAECLRVDRPRYGNVRGVSLSCFVALEKKRREVSARATTLGAPPREPSAAEARTAAETKEADRASWQERRRADEVRRREERGLRSIGAEAAHVAAERCGDRWTESPKDASSWKSPIALCEELRTREIGDPSSCWVGEGLAIAAGGLSLERNPESFTSAPGDCFAVPLNEGERKTCEDACRSAAHEAADAAFTKALDACLARFSESGAVPKEGCEVKRPSSRSFVTPEALETRRAACAVECKAKGPAARAKAAADKAREAKEAAGRGRRDACVRTCESGAERKCEGLPDHGLVGQRSLCLRNALVACCTPCGAAINTTNYSMCTH